MSEAAQTEHRAEWTWESLQSARSVTEVMPEHLDRIRKLVAYWETAESGAGGLADEDFIELGGTDKDAFERAVEVFMTTATLARFGGMIRNPYARANEDTRELLADMPDQAVAALLLSGDDILFEATKEELALWAEANLGAAGIDPKRPFGSESVSRDVRVVVDPQKTLSNAAFARQRKHWESRLVLLLQFFVQNAKLEPGIYRRGGDWRWQRLLPGEASGEMLSRQEWGERMVGQMSAECQDYAETLRCLTHLVWNNRLSGSYATLTEQFKLADHFDSESRADYEGSQEARLRAALQHFPDRKGKTERPWFTLALVRVLNGQARFGEAKDILERGGFYAITPGEADLSTVNPIGTAFLEGIVTRRGLDELGEDEFQSILAGCHSAWRTEQALWTFVWDVQHEPERYKEAAQSPGMSHAKALAAQIELMRGGYMPDDLLKNF